MRTRDLAYLAGFIDGEGCIEFGHGGKSVRVSVSQAYPEVLDWLVDLGWGRLFPGEVVYESGVKRRFRWKVQAKGEVQQFLEEIEPHLKLKKSQAQLALQVLRENRVATPSEMAMMKKLKHPVRVSRHEVSI